MIIIKSPKIINFLGINQFAIGVLEIMFIICDLTVYIIVDTVLYKQFEE